MENLLDFIAHQGYLAVFTLLMFGIFGLPVPDETILMFSGFLSARGHLGLPLIIPVAAVGSMCGISISYFVGRFGGFYLLVKYGHILKISMEKMEKAQVWLQNRGKWSIFIGYYFPGIRHLTALVAGSTRMKYPVFALFAYSGALIWTTTFILLGHFLGEKWQTVAKAIHGHLVLASIVLIAGSVLAYMIFRKTRHKPISP